jgi:hypothetical protein
MTAKQTYLEEELKKSFKSYTLESMQSLVNELQNQDEIDAKLKKEVFNIFFKKCAAKLKKTLSVNFIFGDILIDISDSSEGEWQITTYPKDVQKDEDDEYNPDDGLDGGFCDGSALNAVTYFINPEYITNTKKA